MTSYFVLSKTTDDNYVLVNTFVTYTNWYTVSIVTITTPSTHFINVQSFGQNILALFKPEAQLMS